MDNMTMNDQFPHIGHPITPRITLYIRRKLPRPQKYGDNARFGRHSRKNRKNARLDSCQCDRFVGDVADKLSVCLWSASFCLRPEPERKIFVLIGGGQNVRHQQKVDQDCKMQTWSLVQRGGHFFRDVAKIRSAKCTFDFQRRILRL